MCSALRCVSLFQLVMSKSSFPIRLSVSDQSKDGFVFGDYFLEKKLAAGGMAEVFLGRETDADDAGERCVVKCILPDLAGDQQFLAMFINEAQLAAQMHHANIVGVTDFGEQDGLLYMTMEYVDGLDLRRFARRAFPFGDDHAAVSCLIAVQILDALTYVHNMCDVNGTLLHVVHRDLSPSNIYLSRNGQAKLGDFGIAHINSSRYRQIAYTPRGKFGYVSPEQIEGCVADLRADVFAMGIVLAELLIGKKLFKGPSQLSVLLEIRDGHYRVLEEAKEKIEPELYRIVSKALALKPEHRFQTASEFKNAVTTYMGKRLNCVYVLGDLVANAADTADLSSRFSEADNPFIYNSQDDVSSNATTDNLPSSMVPTNPGRISDSVWNALSSEDDEETTGDATPVTQDLDMEKMWHYDVCFVDGTVKKNISFAGVMEMIYKDDITRETTIAINDGPFMPVESYPELFRHIPVYTPTVNVNDIKKPEIAGMLAMEAPAEIILSLALSEKTGILVCKRGADRKEVYFKRGMPVYTSSNNTEELLGEYLVRKKLLDRAQLETALSIMPKFNGHLGDTVIALGMLSAMELFRAISDQIVMRFDDLILWNSGTWEYYPEGTLRYNAPEIPINPYVHIFDVLFTRAAGLEHDVLVAEMRGQIIEPSPSAQELLRKISLPSDIDSIVRSVTQANIIDSLLQQYDSVSCAVALFVAIEAGIWNLSGMSPSWRSSYIHGLD